MVNINIIQKLLITESLFIHEFFSATRSNTQKRNAKCMWILDKLTNVNANRFKWSLHNKSYDFFVKFIQTHFFVQNVVIWFVPAQEISHFQLQSPQ